MACKRKGAERCKCFWKDDLSPVIDRVFAADALIIGSPIYLGDITSQVHALIERLHFCALSYDDYSNYFTGKVDVGIVLTMNAPKTFYPDMKSDIVFSIPHEYRKVLGRPLSHDCLARVLTAKLAAKDKDKSTETLNTAVRGQIVLGSDESADIAAINGMLQLGAYMQSLPLEGKKQAMLGLVAGSLAKNTFGVSYTGNICWGGMR